MGFDEERVSDALADHAQGGIEPFLMTDPQDSLPLPGGAKQLLALGECRRNRFLDQYVEASFQSSPDRREVTRCGDRNDRRVGLTEEFASVAHSSDLELAGNPFRLPELDVRYSEEHNTGIAPAELHHLFSVPAAHVPTTDDDEAQGFHQIGPR